MDDRKLTDCSRLPITIMSRTKLLVLPLECVDSEMSGLQEVVETLAPVYGGVVEEQTQRRKGVAHVVQPLRNM